MRIKNKRGQIDWYLIISLILGLIILAIAIFWIFQEYFTEESMNWETCRQAVLLRSNIPAEYISDLKEGVSLNCKTSPFVIKTKNKQEAAAEIGDISAKCFSLFGEGKVEIFKRDATTAINYCIVCARISIEEDLRKQYSSDKIPVWSYLKDNRMNSGQSYLSYIYSNFVNHPAVKSSCPELSADSEEIRSEANIPYYWDDTSKDMFVVMAYLNKGKIVFDSLPEGFVNLRCSRDTFPSAIYQSQPPLYSFYISQDINKIAKDCTYIVSIPA